MTDNGIKISIENAQDTEFILPLISGELEIACGSETACEEIFFLTGGFIAQEHIIIPDGNGKIEINIK